VDIVLFDLKPIRRQVAIRLVADLVNNRVLAAVEVVVVRVVGVEKGEGLIGTRRRCWWPNQLGAGELDFGRWHRGLFVE